MRQLYFEGFRAQSCTSAVHYLFLIWLSIRNANQIEPSISTEPPSVIKLTMYRIHHNLTDSVNVLVRLHN